MVQAAQGDRPGGVLAAGCAVLALALPWIDPFAGGPTPSVLPWLVSMACAAWLASIVALRRLPLMQLIGIAWLLAALLNCAAALPQFLGASPLLAPWVNVTELGEAFGNLRQRNQFASLANIGLAVLLWWTPQHEMPIARAAASPRQDAVRWWPCAAAGWLAMGNALSASRTGLFQLALLAALAGMFGTLRNRRARVLLTLAVLVYVAASAFMPLLIGKPPFGAGAVSRFGVQALDCGSRLVLWRNVLHLIELQPWFGWGWGNLSQAHFVTLYPGPRFCAILDNAHNLPLHLAVSFGIPVAVLVCGVLAALVLRARPWRETDDRRRMAWAVLAVIGLHSLLEYPLWYGPFQIATVLAIWILWHGADRSAAVPSGNAAVPHRSAGIPPRPPWCTRAVLAPWVVALAGLVLAALAYAAWDYWRISQIYRPPAQRAPAYRDDTLQKIAGSRLFADQVRFAALTLTSVTPANAREVNQAAHALLAFSPEGRVVARLIDSALLLGRTQEAIFYMRRFRAAYPEEYARWLAAHDAPLPAIDP